MGRVEAYSDRLPDIPQIRIASAFVAAFGYAVRTSVFSLTEAPLKSVTVGAAVTQADKRIAGAIRRSFFTRSVPFLMRRLGPLTGRLWHGVRSGGPVSDILR